MTGRPVVNIGAGNFIKRYNILPEAGETGSLTRLDFELTYGGC